MRIAVITAHYFQSVGYQEVNLTENLRMLGHKVIVITSTHIPKRYAGGGNAREDILVKLYGILRLKCWLAFGTIVFPFELQKILSRINADMMIVIAPGKMFSYGVLRRKSISKFVVLFGDNSDYFRWNSLLSNILSLRMIAVRGLLKRFAYVEAIRNAAKIVFYTPETQKYVTKVTGSKIIQKSIRKIFVYPLGYDQRSFYYDNTERIRQRERYKLRSEDVVVITATRVVPGKGIEEIIMSLRDQGPAVRYIVIGCQGDNYERRLKAMLVSEGMQNSVTLLPFLSRNELRYWYAAADLGVWWSAAISIQEAMGTGLYVLLPEQENVSHLVEKSTGLLYRKQDLFSALRQSIQLMRAQSNATDQRYRETRADHSRRTLSYEIIAKQIIELPS